MALLKAGLCIGSSVDSRCCSFNITAFIIYKIGFQTWYKRFKKEVSLCCSKGLSASPCRRGHPGGSQVPDWTAGPSFIWGRGARPRSPPCHFTSYQSAATPQPYIISQQSPSPDGLAFLWGSRVLTASNCWPWALSEGHRDSGPHATPGEEAGWWPLCPPGTWA